MRVPSACICAVITCVLAACVRNPDPREPSLESMQQQGFGGWVEITMRDGRELRGELLAVDDGKIWLLTRFNETAELEISGIESGELYTYESESGFGVWGLLGTLSTASHGMLLVFSFPIWVLSSSIVAGVESGHVQMTIATARGPTKDLTKLSKWARFPQGMPKQFKQQPVQTKQEDAWQLTQQAQQAARDGKCDVVVALDPRVRELDPGLHEATFLRDEAIRRCLNLPSLLPPTAAPDASPAPDAGAE